MRVLLSALVAAATVQAVDVILYPGNSSCLPGFAALACFDLPPLNCCRPSAGSWQFYSGAKCTGLSATASCATARVSGAGDGRPCGTVCATAGGGGGDSACVNGNPCWAYGAAGFGTYWVQGASADVGAESGCAGAVEPDRAVFANGRAFRINYDVPPRITELLLRLTTADPHLSRGMPAEAAQYEVQKEQEKELTPEGQHVLAA